jgi:hypothetical protein
MENIEKGFEAFVADFDGKLDICVPCAGINKNVPFLETSFEDHQKLVSWGEWGSAGVSEWRWCSRW